MTLTRAGAVIAHYDAFSTQPGNPLTEAGDGLKAFGHFRQKFQSLLNDAKGNHKAASKLAATILTNFGFKRSRGVTYQGKSAKQKLDMWVGMNGATKTTSVWVKIAGKKQSFPLATSKGAEQFFELVAGL